jgi:KUP system potassium uptake protein
MRPRARHTRWWRWRNALFIFMANNTVDATEFFWLPPNRVVELGGQVEI